MNGIINILDTLELDRGVWPFFEAIASVMEGQRKLEEFKNLVKRQRKKLAKLYHPDLDGRSCSHEKMTAINNAVDVVKKMELKIQRPRPVVFRSYTFHSSGTTGSTTTSTW